ncbi:glycosyltransferase family 4 protein [Deinococcus altitudinis]|uniref:glycosyltransferase family 4 protein n=1 Tax=Deinococcus altitudinis TaxID=468914 RepID=UPI003892350A
MKILHILNEFREIGNGIVNVAVDLSTAQAEAGHDVLVVSSGGEYVSLIERFGARHIVLDQSRKPKVIGKAVAEFRKIVADFKPDIVHAHMMTGAILARVCQPGQKYRIVTTVHNEYQKSALFMGLGDKVVAVSAAVARAMVRRGVAARKLEVIHNGILNSHRRIKLSAVSPIELQKPAIVTVGAVSRRKGSLELVDAFNQIAQTNKEVHLYFVGNRDFPEAEQRAHDGGFAERIHFVGFEPQPLTYLLSADIFVLASHQEPFGLAITEAREAGLPVVASDVDGIPEALSHGRSGLLFPVGDIDSLAAAISKLLDVPAHKKYWAEKSSEGLSEFTVPIMANKYMSVYRKLTSVSR